MDCWPEIVGFCNKEEAILICDLQLTISDFDITKPSNSYHQAPWYDVIPQRFDKFRDRLSKVIDKYSFFLKTDTLELLNQINYAIDKSFMLVNFFSAVEKAITGGGERRGVGSCKRALLTVYNDSPLSVYTGRHASCMTSPPANTRFSI